MLRSVQPLALGFALLGALPLRASAFDRERAVTFAVLPEGATGPEGIEVDGAGNVYVATFGFNAQGGVTGSGQIFVFDHAGKLLRQLSVAGSTPNLLGLAFHPTTHALLVIDFGAGQVLDVNPFTGASTPFMTLPATLPEPGGAGLNDLTFDSAGNVYVSDSFQGVVWRTTAAGGTAAVWVDSPLLRTSGVPPFGANGLRFDKAGTALFVANTGSDTVVKVPVASGGAAGAPEVFVNGVNGADGLVVDGDDNIWVVANQSDEVVVLDPTGRVVAKLGDFGGIRDGSPVGMLFPASLRFSGESLLVTNLSLDGRLFGFTTVDSEWCAQVKRYTVVKIPARIPHVAGLPR
jgi:sugar lactone lactonase YvrE